MHSADYVVARCLIFVKLVKHIIKLFSPLVATTFWFATPNGMAMFWWGDPSRASNAGIWKIAIFNQYLTLSQKRYKTESELLWNANRKSYTSFWMVPFSMTLSDLVKYSMTRTRSIVQSLCNILASCFNVLYWTKHFTKVELSVTLHSWPVDHFVSELLSS